MAKEKIDRGAILEELEGEPIPRRKRQAARAFTDEQVYQLDALVAKGWRRADLVKRLKTSAVIQALNRTGAYKEVPKRKRRGRSKAN